MKQHISFLFLSLIILNLISNYSVISEEVESEQKKVSKNIEENDEFDDPSLLKKKSKKKREKSNSFQEEKKPEVVDSDNESIYPSVEQLRQEKLEEINKYKYFFLRYLYEICMISLIIIFILNAIFFNWKKILFLNLI